MGRLSGLRAAQPRNQVCRKCIFGSRSRWGAAISLPRRWTGSWNLHPARTLRVWKAASAQIAVCATRQEVACGQSTVYFLRGRLATPDRKACFPVSGMDLEIHQGRTHAGKRDRAGVNATEMACFLASARCKPGSQELNGRAEDQASIARPAIWGNGWMPRVAMMGFLLDSGQSRTGHDWMMWGGMQCSVASSDD